MENLQQAIAVAAVLASLGIALYLLRTKGLVTFAAKTARGSDGRRLQHLERISLTAQHSLHLVRVCGRPVLIAVSPGGCCLLDSTELQEFHEQERIRG